MALTARVDVIIVGGGPAGAATALALQHQGITASVVERTQYQDFRAGETLGPRSGRLLRELGLWERFVADGHLPSFGVLSAWGGPELVEQNYLFDPHGCGWHVDRRRFDASLADACLAAGVQVQRGVRQVSAERAGDGWRVLGAGPQGSFIVEGARLVDATGRAAAIARARGAHWRRADRLVAVIGVVPMPPEAAVQQTLLVEAVAAGWWYSVPLPGGSLLAAHLTDAGDVRSSDGGAGALWRERLAGALHTRARLPVGAKPDEVMVRQAASGSLDRCAGQGWLAVGDAAFTVDPLSAAGLGKALSSGLAAANAISASLGGDATALDGYADAATAAFDRYLERRAQVYGQERRWPGSPFWRDVRRD